MYFKTLKSTQTGSGAFAHRINGIYDLTHTDFYVAEHDDGANARDLSVILERRRILPFALID